LTEDATRPVQQVLAETRSSASEGLHDALDHLRQAGELGNEQSVARLNGLRVIEEHAWTWMLQ